MICIGVVGLSLCEAGTDSGFRVVERRGGGTVGLGFTSASSSCSSLADLKEDGVEGGFELSMDADVLLLCLGVDTDMS